MISVILYEYKVVGEKFYENCERFNMKNLYECGIA